MTKKIQQNLIFMALVLGGLVYVYYNYLLSPLKAKCDTSLQDLKKTESKLTDMQRRARELPKLQAEMVLLAKEVEGLEKLLPKDREIPDLLRTITKTAHRYQLRVASFSPLPISSQQNYNEIPFQMTLQGNYHALAFFLAEIGQQPRILSVRNINFNSIAANRDNPATVSVNFILVAYTFKG